MTLCAGHPQPVLVLVCMCILLEHAHAAQGFPPLAVLHPFERALLLLTLGPGRYEQALSGVDSLRKALLQARPPCMPAPCVVPAAAAMRRVLASWLLGVGVPPCRAWCLLGSAGVWCPSEPRLRRQPRPLPQACSPLAGPDQRGDRVQLCGVFEGGLGGCAAVDCAWLRHISAGSAQHSCRQPREPVLA